MLVFVASSGKSLELGVEASTRVATIMETLVGVTGVPAADQILMCGGARLDAGKDLGAYGLPAPGGGEAKDVFLFDKSLLRPGGRTAPEEPPKPLTVAEPAEEEASGPHPLDGAASPRVRALPQFERQFRHHARVAAAGRAAAAQRHADCSDLVSEMEVQSRAIDSARLNVELHYTHIHAQLTAFTQQYEAQRQEHARALGSLEPELAALGRVPLHPAARAPGRASLLDLVDAPRLRERAGQAAAAHRGLGAKVAGLQALFGQLRAGVEAVFMQGPSVQLEALATRLHATRPHLDELADVEAVLAADAGQVARLAAAAAAALAAGGGGGATPLDAVQAAEAMHENHERQLLPSVEQVRDVVEAFYARCLHDKNQMARDVAAQLQRISGQQMRIQAIRNQLAAFRAAAAREAELLAQLQRARRAPAAYRQCLAECMRRQAFADVYAGQARQMAERMGRLRQKECAARDAFQAAAAAAAPPGLLAALGLTQQPPHCQISLPPQPALPRLTPADLRAASLPGEAAAGLPPLEDAEQAAAADAGGEGGEAGEGAEGLEMENARLRAELALRMAQESAHALAGRPPPGPGEAGGPELRRMQAAVSAAQDLAARLDAQLGRARAQCAAYETRIGQLEDRLASQAVSFGPGSPTGSPPGRDAPLALTPVVRSPTRVGSPAAPPPPDPPEAPSARASLAEAAANGEPEAGVRISLAVSDDGTAVRLRVAPQQPAP